MTSERSSNHDHGDLRQHMPIVVDPFCFRQFSESECSAHYSGGTIIDNISIDAFEKIVNERFHINNNNNNDLNLNHLLKPGYADFCKHLFVRNDFTNATVNALRITPDNEGCLRSRYEARNDKELPVLTRYFPKELVLAKQQQLGGGGGMERLPTAKYLDLILYSREQIRLENAAQGTSSNKSSEEDAISAPWGIVSIKAQDVDYELPMTPITAMRNALGKEEGGSGVPLNREAYLEAVAYWQHHAVVLQ